MHKTIYSALFAATFSAVTIFAVSLTTLNVAAHAQQSKPAPKASAKGEQRRAINLQPSADLQKLVTRAARTVLDEWKERGLKDENLAITLIDLSDEQSKFPTANFRGGEPVYPASVVKMFYLAAAHRQLQDGELEDTPELRRALRDMIVDSSNDATHYILDLLTKTSSGVELPEAEIKDWSFKRNRVNRYFTALGYQGINVNQKTYCEDIYGRDRVFRGANGENRNRLTTDATARLLAEIATLRHVNPARSREMMELLKRDPYLTGGDMDDQARGFTGRALNGAAPNSLNGGAGLPGVRLWSKAGWTSTTRHDAAYLELPNNRKFILVTYTTNHANEKDIIPTVAREVLSHFTQGK
jgi:beta-lactamase class A